MIDSIENEIFGLAVEELLSSFAPSIIRILAGGKMGDTKQQLLLLLLVNDDDAILEASGDRVFDEVVIWSWLGVNEMKEEPAADGCGALSLK